MGGILDTCRKVDKRNPENRNRKNDDDDVIIRFFMAGLGSAGKSTIIRQLKYLCEKNKEYKLCNNDWSEKKDSDDDTDIMKRAIWNNIINTFDALIKQVELNDDKFDTDEIEQFAKNIEHLYENKDEIDKVEMSDIFINSLVSLLEDNSIQKTLNERNLIDIKQPHRQEKIFDGMEYFMKSDKIKVLFFPIDTRSIDLSLVFQEVFRDDYIPSYEDKIHCRLATTDVVRYYFKINHHKIQIYDAGGQVSERLKLYEYIRQWQNDTNTKNSQDYIFFVTSLSDFNIEHDKHDGFTLLEESQAYMEFLLGMQLINHCGLLIFFNKKDRFMSKLNDNTCRDSCIKHLSKFLNTTDIDNYKNNGEYNKKKMFDAVRKPFIQIIKQKYPNCKSFYRDTCAIDSKIMEAFFSVLKETQKEDVI